MRTACKIPGQKPEDKEEDEVIKTIQVEPIKNREHFLNMPFLTKEEVKTAMDR